MGFFLSTERWAFVDSKLSGDKIANQSLPVTHLPPLLVLPSFSCVCVCVLATKVHRTKTGGGAGEERHNFGRIIKLWLVQQLEERNDNSPVFVVVRAVQCNRVVFSSAIVGESVTHFRAAFLKN